MTAGFFGDPAEPAEESSSSSLANDRPGSTRPWKKRCLSICTAKTPASQGHWCPPVVLVLLVMLPLVLAAVILLASVVSEGLLVLNGC